MRKLEAKEKGLNYIKSQCNKPEKIGSVSSENETDENHRRHIDFLEKRLAEIRRESTISKATQNSKNSSSKDTTNNNKIGKQNIQPKETSQSNKTGAIDSNPESAKNHKKYSPTRNTRKCFKTKYIVYAITLISLSAIFNNTEQGVRFWSSRNDSCDEYALSRYQKTLCHDKHLAELHKRLEQNLTPSELSYFETSTLRACTHTTNLKYSTKNKVFSLSEKGCIEDMIRGALSSNLW